LCTRVRNRIRWAVYEEEKPVVSDLKVEFNFQIGHVWFVPKRSRQKADSRQSVHGQL